MTRLVNRAGDVEFRPGRFARPGSLDEVRELVTTARRVRGAGHSSGEVAATDGRCTTPSRCRTSR